MEEDGKPTLEQVGVVGAGTMGAGIAQVALEAGHPVVLHDPDPAALDRARSAIAAGLARRAARRSAEGASADEQAAQVSATLERLRIAGSPAEAAADATLVIEAAIEDLETKVLLFADLDAAAPPDALLATNTSALSVAAIAAGALRPGRVLGLHFFNPAPVMRLVEVVGAPATEERIVDRAVRLMADWGKTPVRCRDTPGFIVNRVNRPFTLEALRILEAGEADVGTVDTAMRAAGFPMGPFELMDLVGIDVNLAAARALFEAFGGEPRFRPSAVQERLVAAGRLGRKTGEGFYRYDADRRALGVSLTPADRAQPAQPESDPDRPADRIIDRITLAIVNEAYHALDDAVASPSDIDVALRLGASHPLGPFERADVLGGPVAVRTRLAALASELGPRFRPAPALVSAARREAG
jgi:3-hydroxybutyryl-CoA dehydrogenase